VHEPADALDQVGRLEPFLDQHELDTGVQSLTVFGAEIKRGDDDNWDIPLNMS